MGRGDSGIGNFYEIWIGLTGFTSIGEVGEEPSSYASYGGWRIKRVQNGGEFWYNIAMSYEDAIKKAKGVLRYVVQLSIMW